MQAVFLFSFKSTVRQTYYQNCDYDYRTGRRKECIAYDSEDMILQKIDRGSAKRHKQRGNDDKQGKIANCQEQ